MNYLKYGLLVVVLAAIAYVGYSYPQNSASFGSVVGSTFNDAKIVAVDMTPSATAATSSSILNTDSSARWIEGGVVACTGVSTGSAGTANLTVQAATTSITTAGLNGNANLAFNLVVATSSAVVYAASSTVASGSSVGNADNYYWAAGTYMTFNFNTTNPGACLVKLAYLPS